MQIFHEIVWYYLAYVYLLNEKLDSSWLNNTTKFYLRMGNSPQQLENGIPILNQHTGFESVLLIVLRLGTSCGSFPSPECLIFLSKDMVQGLRKTWLLCWDMVSNSGNFPLYWPHPTQTTTPDFKAYRYTSQISINILGTENFHRKPPAAGLNRITILSYV